MTGRRISVGIAVAMLAMLTASGTTLAGSSAACAGTAGSSAIGSGYYDADFHCVGTFSQFTVKTDKQITAGTVHAAAYNRTHSSIKTTLSCKATATTISCAGVPAGTGQINVNYQSTQPCPRPMVTTSVTVSGKPFSLPASCQY